MAQTTVDKRSQQSESGAPASVLEGEHTFASVTDKISAIVLTQKTGWGWLLASGSRSC